MGKRAAQPGSLNKQRRQAVQSTPATNNEPPETLTGSSKEFWCQHWPTLVANGIVTDMDRAAFTVVCKLWERLLAAEGGKTFTNLATQFKLQCNLFGLNPYARKRMAVTMSSNLDRHEGMDEFTF